MGSKFPNFLASKLMCTKKRERERVREREKEKERERKRETHKVMFPKAKTDIMTVSLSTPIAFFPQLHLLTDRALPCQKQPL